MIVSIIVIFAESACASIFFGTFQTELRYRRSIPIKLASILALAGMSFIISYFFEDQTLKSVLMILSFFSYNCFYFKSSPLLDVFISALMYLLMVVMDFVIISIFSAVYETTTLDIKVGSIYYPWGIMISKTALLMVIITIYRIFKKNDRNIHVRKIDWVILLSLSGVSILNVISFVELYSYTLKYKHKTGSLGIYSALAMLLLNFVVFYLFDTMNERVHSQNENILLNQQMQIQLEGMDALSNAYNTQRKLSHDFSNHMLTLNDLLVNEKFSQAQQYAQMLSKDVHLSTYRIRTNNDYVDAILNVKDLSAREKGIVLDINCDSMENIFMSDKDMVTILSNTLDNSIEACNKLTDGKIIKLLVKKESNKIIISLRNRVNKKVAIINNKIETTKADKSIHGIGLRSVELTLEKYGSSYELYCDDSWFQFTAIIYDPNHA